MSQSNKIIKGAVILSIAGLFAKVLSMFFRVPLVYLTGDEGVGYYQTFYTVFLILIAFSMSGMPQALSKLISENIANDKTEEAQAYFRTAFVILLIFGVLTSLFIIIFADYIIKFNSWSPGTKYVMYSLSIAPTFVGISGAFRGYFQGMQIMKPIAIAQVIENFTKVIIGIALTYILLRLGYSTSIAVAGAAIGTTLGFLFSVIFLFLVFKKNKKFSKNQIKINKKATLFTLFKVAIPITIGASAYSIMNFIDSMTLFKRLRVMNITSDTANAIYGQITKAYSVVNVPLTIAIAIMISTLPAISEAKIKSSKEDLFNSINTSIRLAMMLAFPAGVGLIVLAEPIMKLIYRNEYLGYEYLALFGICLVFLILGQTIASILQGLGKYLLPIYAIFFSIIVKTVLNYTLISSSLLGKGALIGSIGFYITFTIVNYVSLVRETRVKIPINQVFLKPIASSLIMGLVVFGVYNIGDNIVSGTISVLLSVVLGMLAYLLSLCILKGLNEEDIRLLPKSRIIIKMMKKIKLI